MLLSAVLVGESLALSLDSHWIYRRPLKLKHKEKKLTERAKKVEGEGEEYKGT